MINDKFFDLEKSKVSKEILKELYYNFDFQTIIWYVLCMYDEDNDSIKYYNTFKASTTTNIKILGLFLIQIFSLGTNLS